MSHAGRCTARAALDFRRASIVKEALARRGDRDGAAPVAATVPLLLIRSDRHARCTRNAPEKGRATMVGWAALFLAIAIVAAVFGFAGIAASAAGVAKVLFVVFLVLAGISLLLGRRIVA
jgi:uncharacterized membrane protein YtjA (UPF0391 family)